MKGWEMTQSKKGIDREKSLDRDVYFSDHYFSLPQLCSYAHQLNRIWRLKPASVMEIGIGNGFVSTYLRRAGVPVTTVDINADLNPDICSPLHELNSKISKKVDLIVCCEVLEHMPLSELERNLDYLRAAGERLFLTLPNVYRTWGLAGLLNLPKIGAREIDLNMDIPYKHNLSGGEHYWEVGHSVECSRRSIVKKLENRYSKVSAGRFTLNPYHIWFECQ